MLESANRSNIYRDLLTRVSALAEGETDQIALMATMACEVYHAFETFHWVGFYRRVGQQILKIGPYQGGHGCLTIDFDRGVCGRCARTAQPQLVADVLADTDHIACAASTRSELVMPVFDKAGALCAVFDIDSDLPDHFSENDIDGLEPVLALFKNI